MSTSHRFRTLAGVPAVLSILCAGSARADLLLPAPAGAAPLITTPLDPANYVVTPPSGFDSVAKLIIGLPGGTFGCSGSLIGGGNYVLTAAHCVTDSSVNGGTTPAASSFSATFFTGAGSLTYSGAEYFLPPGWNGDFENGADLALVRLSATVPLASYDLFRANNPSQTGTADVAGYGFRGLGSTGSVSGTFGALRAGGNTLDGIVWNMPGFPFAWDFDNGLAQNDALGILEGVNNTGLGAFEVMIAPGDSGGPLFIGGQLAGVHSFGATAGAGWGDVDNLLNSSFGEIAGDTRVAEYAGWIDSVVTPVPEPGALGLLGAGLPVVLGWLLRLRRKRA
ncbi:MAG: S1 family peptidase [Acidobacteria bacterium]|nr:S1 family peptidase [Acidobacteriota bacterium]